MNRISQIRSFKSHGRASFLWFLFFAFCFCVSSCNKKDSFVLDFQYEYAPIDTGHYVIYDVDSILYSYNGIQINDTVRYQLKEVITDTFYFTPDELYYRLELYRRADETSSWVFDRAWYTRRTTTTFLKVEDDKRFIKLVFPPETDKEWNGNIHVSVTDPFGDFENWNYRYENMDVPYSINGFNFDSTLSVIEVNDSNALDKRLRKEVYAKGVGMIYQEWEILHLGQGVPVPIVPNWQSGNMDGFRIRMKVREHN